MNLGAAELLVILAVLLLIFGASQLPKLARSLGQSARELRRGFDDSDEPEAGGTGSNEGSAQDRRAS